MAPETPLRNLESRLVLHEVLVKTSSGRKSIIIDSDLVRDMGVSEANEQNSALYLASWLSLLADSPLNAGRKPFKTYRLFLDRIRREGLKSVVLHFTDLAHELVSQRTCMGAGPSIGYWIPEFANTPVFYEYIKYYKTGDTKVLKFLYTFLNFGKKLEYVDESFHETALRGWLGIEKRLGGQRLHDKTLSAIRLIAEYVLPPFSWTDLRPKFGPGSVQERGIRGRLQKIENLRYDPYIDRFLLRGHVGSYGLASDLGVSVQKVIPLPENWDPAKGRSSRTARLRFVPKNLKVSRSICMEPNTLMYFQQAVGHEFNRLIGESPLRQFINIRDQERNKRLARHGSETGEIDTLDLSAASDSLDLRIVREVFPASWQIPMLTTRSNKAILPDGTEVPLHKFAPMGSALCFPTQCIFFTCVCILAACIRLYESGTDDEETFLQWLSKDRNIRRTIGRFVTIPHPTFLLDDGWYQPLAVYGDDICVDRKLTGLVTSILSILGFEVNKTKSFVGVQSFRESCGGFYMDGDDITPLYYRVKGVKPKLTASHVVSQVHLANEAWKNEYKNLYRFLRSSIATWDSRHRDTKHVSQPTKNPIPYVLDPDLDFGLMSLKPVNSHLRVRENVELQRTEYRVWTISYDWKEHPSDLSGVDAYEYMRWWAGRSGEIDPDPFNGSVSRADTGGARIQWRWTPLY